MTLDLRPRSAWTSTSVGGAVLTGVGLVGLAPHWPGTTLARFGVESASRVAERLRGWRTFHVSVRGWSDIGYNFAVDQAGRVWQLRSTNWSGNRVGAHSASPSNPQANRHRVGVLFILGASEEPSNAMIVAFQTWRFERFLAGWPGRTQITGHGQVPGASTSCPGPRVRARISDGTLARRPSGSVPPPPPPPRSWFEMATKKELAEVVDERLNNTIIKHTTKNNAWHQRTLESRTANIRADQAAIREQNAAILAAVSGLDAAAVLAKLDAHHADYLARFEAAEGQREELLGLVERQQSGELTAQQVVDELSRRLNGPDGDEDL